MRLVLSTGSPLTCDPKPTEVWLLILQFANQGEDAGTHGYYGETIPSEEVQAILAFSMASRQARAFAMTLFPTKLFVTHSSRHHFESLWYASPFFHIKTLVLHFRIDFSPHYLSIVIQKFPHLQRLAIVAFVPTGNLLVAAETQLLFSNLVSLARLTSLRHFGLHIHVPGELDVSGLIDLLRAPGLNLHTLVLELDADNFVFRHPLRHPERVQPVRSLRVSDSTLDLLQHLPLRFDAVSPGLINDVTVSPGDEHSFHQVNFRSVWQKQVDRVQDPPPTMLPFINYLAIHRTITHLKLSWVHIPYALSVAVARMTQLVRLDWHPVLCILWPEVTDWTRYRPTAVDSEVYSYTHAWSSDDVTHVYSNSWCSDRWNDDSGRCILREEEETMARYLFAAVLPGLTRLETLHFGTELLTSAGRHRNDRSAEFWEYVWARVPSSLRIVGLGVCGSLRTAHRHVTVCSSCRSPTSFDYAHGTVEFAAWRRTRRSCLAAFAEACQTLDSAGEWMHDDRSRA